MRLDHLLSREPVMGTHTGRGFPVCVCFLCLHLVAARLGGGCGCVWVGYRNEASMLSGSRSTPVGRYSPRLVQVTVLVVWGGCVVCCL